jgi:hypothetical protein
MLTDYEIWKSGQVNLFLPLRLFSCKVELSLNEGVLVLAKMKLREPNIQRLLYIKIMLI